MATQGSRQTFHIIMIKPTHYGDDGYPIQWMRTIIPSNSLACVNGLARDCAERKVLGEDVDIQCHAIDETNTRVNTAKLISMARQGGARALIVMVGVQTNQFPRAVDLSQPFLKAGLQVCIGGFHVSGCISMLDEVPDDIRDAQEMGISMFLGEAEEGRFEEVVRDAFNGDLKARYNYLANLPNITGEPVPFLSREIVDKLSGRFSSFDIGRGCPFECSFCSIINVHGRKSRFRSGEDLERIVRDNHKHGINQFFITDDNLARNKNWEELFDTLIRLRKEDGIKLRLMVQVDTLCHRIPNFIEKAVKAGVDQVFVGMENINPENLALVKKRQNRILEYRQMFLEWKKHPVLIYAGYIIGFPNDTPESIIRDVEVIKKELPIDCLYFTNLTPLPGSEDHARMTRNGEWMDPDMNKYDLNHRVVHHAKMSDEEWDAAYMQAWKTFYDKDHMRTILRRVYGCRSKKRRVTQNRLAWYTCFPRHFGVHPLEGGYMPLRFRNDRRPTMPRESIPVFYARYAFDLIHHNVMLWGAVARLRYERFKIERDPKRFEYRDLALTPPGEDEHESFNLYSSESAKQAIEKKTRQDKIKAGVHKKAAETQARDSQAIAAE